MNFSTTEAASSTRLERYGRDVGSARGLRDEGQRGCRGAGQVDARLLGGDVEQLAQAPRRGERRDRALYVGAHVTGVDRRVHRLGPRQARLKEPSTSSPHTSPYETVPTMSSMSTPR